MITKTLANEYKKEIENIGTLYYSSPNEKKCDVISITMKGKFSPTIEKKEYSKDLKYAKNKFIEEGNKIIKNNTWYNAHYIFTTDFTENGIQYNKKTKYKYQLYIKPNTKDNIETYEENIMNIIGNLNNKLVEILEAHSFIIS